MNFPHWTESTKKAHESKCLISFFFFVFIRLWNLYTLHVFFSHVSCIVLLLFNFIVCFSTWQHFHIFIGYTDDIHTIDIFNFSGEIFILTLTIMSLKMNENRIFTSTSTHFFLSNSKVAEENSHNFISNLLPLLMKVVKNCSW